MIDPDEGDRRIAEREQDLARLQTDATYRQIEANLVRERLKATLGIAVSVIGRMTAAFDGNLARMADDLNGGGQHD